MNNITKENINKRGEYNIKCCDILKDIISLIHPDMRFEQLLYCIFPDGLNYGRESVHTYEILSSYLKKFEEYKKTQERHKQQVDVDFINQKLNADYTSIDEVSERSWSILATKCELSEEFIEKYIEQLGIIDIIRNQKLSEEFLLKYQEQLSWEFVAVKQTVSVNFFKEHYDLMPWMKYIDHHDLSNEFIEVILKSGKFNNTILTSQKVSPELLDKYVPKFDKYDWWTISEKQNLSYEQIDKYADKLDWRLVAHYQILNSDLIRKYKDKLQDKWDTICYYQNLTDDIIEEFIDNIDFSSLIGNKTILSEYIIEKYSHKIDKYTLFSKQYFSEDFLNKHTDWWLYDSLVCNAVISHQKVSENFIRTYKDKLKWCSVTKYQTLSEDFIKEMRDYVDWALVLDYQKLSLDFICKMKYYFNETQIILSENIPAEYKEAIKKYNNI